MVDWALRQGHKHVLGWSGGVHFEVCGTICPPRGGIIQWKHLTRDGKCMDVGISKFQFSDTEFLC